MSTPLRICLWTSGFQADSQALAHHLGQQPGIALTIAMDQPARYAGDPVTRILPIQARLVDRAERGAARRLRQEGFDLLIVDNHLPDEAIAPRLFVLWHGFGWRIDDLSTMRKELKALVGDTALPNPRFRWQAFGDWDRSYRIEHSGFAPENVVALGSAYSDLLLPEAEGGAGGRLTEPAKRKTVLLGLTWHHGAALAQWGDDATLLGRLFNHLSARGADVIVRMHDKHRFEPAYLAEIERVAAGRRGVEITFRSEHPDSLTQLLRSDVMVSNYSSLLNAFYYTRKPTVHLDPHAPGQEAYVYRRWKGGRLRSETVGRAELIWKLDPEEIGGLRARAFEEALAAIDRGLDDPRCCEEVARAFTDRYITGADGQSCARIERYLRGWLAEPA